MGWFSFVIFIGAAVILLEKHNIILSILAEASYWIYLIHVPILMSIQERLLHKGIPLVGEFVISVMITLSICLLTYPLIRNTWIGKGPKKAITPSSNFALTN
jgi:glucan biosynthesis protein C